MRAMVSLTLILVLPVLALASPQLQGPMGFLQIEGMEPMTQDDLSRFTAFAMRLADASRTDPRVIPLLEETLSGASRGIVKRSIAYLALMTTGREQSARIRVGANVRDQAVMKIVRACLYLQENLTMVPGQ